KEGLAAAVGSQLRSGGTSRYAADDFDEEVDFLAAEISSSIGPTSGTVSANFLAKDTDRALELLFEMLRHPAFQPDRLEIHRGQQLQAIERRNDRTDVIESREWNRLLRGDRHFSSVMSTAASLAALTREDLVEFHRAWFHPGNFIFAVSGDFKTSEMKAKLENAMAGWDAAGAAPPQVPKPEYIPAPGVYMVDKPEVNQARVSIGHLGITRGDPDEIAVTILNGILGGSGFTSRIMNRVRSEEGLAYDAGSSYSAGIYYAGHFRAGFQSGNATSAQAARIVIDEIERIRREPVAPEELETVKNLVVESFPRVFSTSAAIAQTFAADEYTKRDPLFWKTYRDRVHAVTVEDVQRVARDHLHPEKLVILAVGNVGEMMKGNPDKPEYSFSKLAGGEIIRIPLPDPLTMIYPMRPD
ncbi:MAG TPA: pitrilysin family protein, partial [Acidobacteriota bacterium]|nr:pitrilysin family protein [Acidobacteriota bacterium]